MQKQITARVSREFTDMIVQFDEQHTYGEHMYWEGYVVDSNSPNYPKGYKIVIGFHRFFNENIIEPKTGWKCNFWNVEVLFIEVFTNWFEEKVLGRRAR